MIALCSALPALAGVRVEHGDARLSIAARDLPDAFEAGQWSLLVWVHAPRAVEHPGSILAVGGHAAVTADAQGVSVWLQHRGHAAHLRLDEPLRPGQWHLLALSMDARAAQAQAWLAAEGAGPAGDGVVADRARLTPIAGGRGLSRAADPDAAPRLDRRSPSGGPPGLSVHTPLHRAPGLSKDVSGLIVGSLVAGLPAAELIYEALAVRDHPLNDTDVRAVWLSRDYYAGHSLDTRATGGRMTGWRGCRFLTFHAVSPDANGAGLPDEKSSFVGGPVRSTNLLMVRQPTELTEGRSGSFMFVGPVVEARGFTFTSRLESELEGFFNIEPAPFDAPTEPIGTLGPKARMLASTPTGLVRVMVSANSRGVRGSLGPQPWPEGFAHGFVQELLPQTAGVMMRPATLLDGRGGWLGLDTSTSSPDTVLVRALHARTDAWGDWTRFGSGTLPAASRGPGPATSISPGGVYRLRCGPVDGSLLRADEPLVVRSTLLAFPGSSDLHWVPERGFMQDGEGLELDGESVVPLDTTRVEHTMADGDAMPSPTRLVLEGAFDVRPDDAVVIVQGPARGAVSVVTAAEFADGRTTIDLSHPFGVSPTAGAQMRIGPWRFVAVEHRFEPVPSGDDRTWRGQVLRAPDDGKLGFMLYATDAWRPDVDGFVFGSAGQSGTGYTRQLESAFPGATAAWAAHSGVDVWIEGLAQQHSQPPAMWDYLDVLRDGMGPDAEIIWASDAVHAHTTHHAWHYYLRDNAAAAGVPAIFAVGDPRIGSYFAQAASGMRTDDAHYSSFGSRIIARSWLTQLRRLGSGTCDLADYDGSGTVDVFDMLVFQTDWEAGVPRADLDGDGQFLIFDYLVLLTAIDQCR